MIATPTRRWLVLAGALLALVGSARSLRAPAGATRDGAPAAMAMFGLPAPFAEGVSPDKPSSRPIQAVCAMSYPDAVQTAKMVERYQLSRLAEVTAAHSAASLDVRLSHRLASGRLVVLMDGKTILSKPFDGPAGDRRGTLSHLISVTPGRHAMEVQVLGPSDEMLGRAQIEGVIPADRVVVLKADHRPEKKPGVRLEWSSQRGEDARALARNFREGEDDAPTERD